MSIKRQATSDLNHDNWDQEDPSEHEDMGKFKTASKDVLEKRVMKTARRRNLASSSEEHHKNVFSGFGGFNKTQPSSFDFLRNLTNGSKTNGSATNIPEVSISSPSLLFGNRSSETTSSGTFSTPSVTTSMTFGSLAKSTLSNTNTTGSIGTLSTSSTSKSDLTSNTAFKITTAAVTDPKNTNASSIKASPLVPQANAFGSPATSTSKVFTSNTSSILQTSKNTSIEQEKDKLPDASTSPNNNSELSEHKLKYYSKLKGLNESVSAWIKKHVETNALCLLSPIFKDYEKHLKTIQDEFQEAENKVSSVTANNEISKINTDSKIISNESSSSQNTKSCIFSSNITTKASENNSFTKDVKPGFTFGIKPITSAITSSASFSFGINTTSNQTSTPFSVSTNTNSETSAAAAPFSFGIGKPFSFNSNVQKPTETTEKEPNNEDEDEPPKVEYTKIEEENSVYDKKCKVFVKKDDNFADRGVGTLYIKKIENSGKYQLLVRANTSLGNILLNIVLSASIPTQRMGKNNVMIVCIPTPDVKPPPTPILIRVKTAEEADELLEMLNKYKA